MWDQEVGIGEGIWDWDRDCGLRFEDWDRYSELGLGNGIWDWDWRLVLQVQIEDLNQGCKVEFGIGIGDEELRFGIRTLDWGLGLEC